MTKLKCIMLIDDDEATNFYHKVILKKLNYFETIITMDSAIDALAYLSENPDGPKIKPDLIFLDINMPLMNGWEFLEEYEKLNSSQRAEVVLIMLTTSLNPDDRAMAEKIESVSGFLNKPLNGEKLDEILKNYFETPINSEH